MSTTNSSTLVANADQIREQWLRRITDLVATAESWAKELGWATRRIDTRIEDDEVGNHRAPALLLQENTTRIILQPIGRSPPPTEAYADMYLMPAYDDVARLFFENGGWKYFHNFPGSHASHETSRPLTKEAFQEILREMLRHASELI